MTRPRSAILALILLLFANALSGADRPPVVVVSTTMIRSMLDYLVPEDIDARTIIPAAACPGTYDLRPSDAAQLARADLIVRHDYQAYLDSRLLAQNPGIPVRVLDTPGSLVAPDNYLAVMSRLRDILSKRFPGLSGTLDQNYRLAEAEVKAVEQEARDRIAEAGLPGSTVLCADKQASFMRWAGINVAAAFTSSPDELSVFQLARTISAGRESGARFVVGNQQSGGEAVARGVAGETGLPVAILSNFPGSNERNGSWRELLFDNIDLLARAFNGAARP